MDARAGSAAAAAGGVAAAAGLLLFGPRLVGPALGGLPDAPAEAAFTLILFGALAAMALAGGRLSGVAPFAWGGRPVRAAAVGAALGLAGVGTAVAYAALAGTLGCGAGGGALPLLLLGLLTVAVQVWAEEAYFRGWLQPLLARSWGALPAIVAVALAFAGLHALAGASGAPALANLFAGGLLFGLLAARGGGIAGAVAAHGAWNAAEQLALGLDPNPGVGGFGALLDLDLAGASAWGGSEQGLNASLGMTFALTAIVAPLLLARRNRPAGGAAAAA